MFEGGEELLLRDPRVGQSSKSTDLATGNFHSKAVSFSGFQKQLNSVQIFARTHSRHEGLPPKANIEVRTAWLRVSIGRNHYV
jgi:hypothetical protein